MKKFITTPIMIAIAAIMLSLTPISSSLHAQNSTVESSVENRVVKHKTIKIDGLDIFYREAGPKNLEFNLIDTGHFALEEDGIVIAQTIRAFLGRSTSTNALEAGSK